MDYEEYSKVFNEVHKISIEGIPAQAKAAFDDFKSQFIKYLQNVSVEEEKITEFKRILDTPTGDLIAYMAFFAARKSSQKS